MKVIMISGDPFILDPESNVRKRILEYGALTSELHILVLSKKIPTESNGGCVQLSSNIWVYPIRSTYRFIALLSGLKLGYQIIRKLHTNKSESLITAQDPFEIGFLSWMLTTLFRLPLQLQVHNDFYNPHFVHESKVSNIRQWLAKFLLPKATAVRVVNNTIKELLTDTALAIPVDRVTLLPVFVDTGFIKDKNPLFNLKQKYPQFSHHIIMLGRLGKQKNYPIAFKVFQEVLKTIPNSGLIILGEGSEEHRLKRLIAKYKLTDNVIFEGRKNDVVSYYKGADIFLHTANYEGYGMVFVEAAAAGIPMVSTSVGIMGDVFINEESTLISRVEDVGDLAANTVRLLNDIPLRQILVKNAYTALTLHTYPNKKEYLKKYAESWEKCLYKK